MNNDKTEHKLFIKYCENNVGLCKLIKSIFVYQVSINIILKNPLNPFKSMTMHINKCSHLKWCGCNSTPPEFSKNFNFLI